MEHYVLIQQTHLFVYAAVLLVQPEKHHWIIATLVPVKMEILALIEQTTHLLAIVYPVCWNDVVAMK